MRYSNEIVSGPAGEVPAHHPMTMEEVSAETRIPVNTLRFYRHKGVGPKFAKLGGRLMAKRDEMAKWIDAAFEAEAS